MITVLAASGATGLELTRQALERGHRVRAIARDPRRITLPDSPLLTRVPGDVTDPESIAAALAGSRILVSGLGLAGRPANETPTSESAGKPRPAGPRTNPRPVGP